VQDASAVNWPTPLQESALRALMARDRPAIHAWLAGVTPPLDRFTRALLPSISLLLGAEASRFPWVSDVYRGHWLGNQQAIHAGLETADRLLRAGIPAVLMKGVPLLLFHYREVGARPMHDADLVLPATDLLRADEVLRAAGWHRKVDPAPALLPFVTAIDYLHPNKANLDVQRYPFLPRSGARAVRRFWSRVSEREVRGLRFLCPDATIMLLITCLHGRKPEGSLARWPLDAHAILSRDTTIDWDEFVATASDAGIVAPVRDALAYLAGLGLPIPAEPLAELLRIAPSAVDLRRYRRLVTHATRHHLADVIALRWEEHVAGGGHASGFPAYFVKANTFYRGRTLTWSDVKRKLGWGSEPAGPTPPSPRP
jgi:hypothetical protein